MNRRAIIVVIVASTGALAGPVSVWVAHGLGQWSHARALHSASVDAAHAAAVTAEAHAKLLHESAIPIAFGPRVPLKTQCWVTVLNPDGAGHGDPHGVKPCGEVCSVERGESVLMVATGEVGVIVEVLPRAHAADVSSCPAGTLFRMPAFEYRASEAQAKAEAEHANVGELNDERRQHDGRKLRGR